MNNNLKLPSTVLEYDEGRDDRIAALEAELAERTRERDKARADVQWMFDKAAEREPTLDGYRELGAKCAALEAELDAERERRAAAETLLRDIQYSSPVGVWPHATMPPTCGRYED